MEYFFNGFYTIFEATDKVRKFAKDNLLKALYYTLPDSFQQAKDLQEKKRNLGLEGEVIGGEGWIGDDTLKQ